jgi:hypothetical protein
MFLGATLEKNLKKNSLKNLRRDKQKKENAARWSGVHTC